MGLAQDDITIRMTGCPNGCARPYLAEIGLVGRSPGIYNLYLGGAFDGTRLNKLYRRDVDGDAIVAALAPLFREYAEHRDAGERFGDYVIRAGHIRPTTAGNTFHADLAPTCGADHAFPATDDTCILPGPRCVMRGGGCLGCRSCWWHLGLALRSAGRPASPR